MADRTTPQPINVRLDAATDAILRALAERFPVLTRHRLAALALELGAKELQRDPLRAFGAPSAQPVDRHPVVDLAVGPFESRPTREPSPACVTCGSGVASKCTDCGAPTVMCGCPEVLARETRCAQCHGKPRTPAALDARTLIVAPRRSPQTPDAAEQERAREAVKRWQGEGPRDRRSSVRSNVAIGKACERAEGTVRQWLRGEGNFSRETLDAIAAHMAANP